MEELEAAAIAFASDWFKGDGILPYWFAARSSKYRSLINSLCDKYLDTCLGVSTIQTFTTPRVAVLVAILLDQMPRNARAVGRLEHVEETDSVARQILASTEIPYDALSIPEICFASLVWRHSRTLADFDRADAVVACKAAEPLVQRFMAETESARQKLKAADFIAWALSEGRPMLRVRTECEPADTTVLDQFRIFMKPDMQELSRLPLVEELRQKLNGCRRVLLSLSGGVDSMAHLLLLSAIPEIQLLALHLAYPLNRPVGVAALETEWIGYACDMLGVPLYTFNVELKRPHDDASGVTRDEFERVTREIRFRMYREMHADVVILGHHADDKDENALEQLTRGHVLGDLCGMAGVIDMHGVHLMRPLIHRRKADFKGVCEKFSLFHLADSTPDWSVRGQTRMVLNHIIQSRPDLCETLQSVIVQAGNVDEELRRRLSEWIVNGVETRQVHGVKVVRLKIQSVIEELPGLANLTSEIAAIADWWNAGLEHLDRPKALQSIREGESEALIIFERALHHAFEESSHQMNLKSIKYIWAERPLDDGTVKYGGATERIAFAWRGSGYLFIYESKDVHNAKGMRKTLLSCFD